MSWLLRIALSAVAVLSALPASAETLVVTRLDDAAVSPPPGSLRERYNAASANDVITFAEALDGGTIALETTLILSKSLTIDASSLPRGIVLSGGRTVRPILVPAGATVRLVGFTVAHGFATSGGGAIENGGRLALERMTLRDSVTTGGNNAGCGGGICNQSTGVLSIHESTIIHNISFFVGGGIGALNGGSLTVTSSLIAFNESGNSGGGIGVRSVGAAGTTTLTNVTVTGNRGGIDGGSSGDGVALVKSGAATNTATLRNSTIAFNTGSAFGLVTTGTASVGNTILWGNSFPDIGAASGGVLTAPGHNLYGTKSGYTDGPEDIAGLDPRLSQLGSYGGPTQTLALLPGSPAINLGNANGAPTTDQRGIARAVVDIGAFESRGFTFSLSGNEQRTLVSTPYAVPLGVSVTATGTEPVAGGRVTLSPPTVGPRLTSGNTFLTLDAAGRASQAVTANALPGAFTVSVSAAGATPASFSLTNLAAVSLGPVSLGAATANTAYREVLVGGGGTAPYTFTVQSGSLPPGLTLALDGTLAGTPTTAGSYTFGVTATDSSANSGPFRASRSYTLTVGCPTIRVDALPDGVVGEGYAEVARATPPAPYVFSVSEGALPAGLELGPDGLITGTVSEPGPASFTLRATGFGSCSGSAVQALEFRCAHCEIDGACVDAGQLDPANPCRVCDPFASGFDYSARPAGVSCPDDGLAHTADRCDGAGLCVHEERGVCAIEGTVYPGGAAHPTEPCLVCAPWLSATRWSPAPAGSLCTDDGLSCTRDVCDEVGVCTHPVSGGCLVDGACVEPGAADPTNECAVCDPFSAAGSFSARPDGVACSEDGDPCTLDTCQLGVCQHPRLLCADPDGAAESDEPGLVEDLEVVEDTGDPRDVEVVEDVPDVEDNRDVEDDQPEVGDADAASDDPEVAEEGAPQARSSEDGCQSSGASALGWALAALLLLSRPRGRAGRV